MITYQVGPIPANSVLHFELELDGIKPPKYRLDTSSRLIGFIAIFGVLAVLAFLANTSVEKEHVEEIELAQAKELLAAQKKVLVEKIKSGQELTEADKDTVRQRSVAKTGA